MRKIPLARPPSVHPASGLSRRQPSQFTSRRRTTTACFPRQARPRRTTSPGRWKPRLPSTTAFSISTSRFFRRSFSVRIFKDLDSFNAYLDQASSPRSARISSSLPGPTPRGRSSCASRRRRRRSPLPSSTRGAIQFIKGFIDNPPVWLREGIATYLDESPYGIRRPARSRSDRTSRGLTA